MKQYKFALLLLPAMVALLLLGTGAIGGGVALTGGAGTTGQFAGDNTLHMASTSPLSQSTKTVNTAQARRGDVITYTIILRNTGPANVTARVTDTMPSEVGSAVLSFPPGGTGTVIVPGGTGSFIFPGSLLLPTGSNWVWTGVISAGTQVKLTLRVTLRPDITQITGFANQLEINDGLGNIFSIASPQTLYDGRYRLFLPIIIKNYPPPIVPVNCAPTHLIDIPVGTTPRGLAVDQGRNRVYVANENQSTVSVIDGRTNTVIKTVQGAGISAPTRVAYDALSSLVWVASRGSSGTLNSYWVNPITATTFNVGPAVPLPAEATAMVFNPVDRNLYLAQRWNDSVTVINTVSRSVVNTMTVGSQPTNLAVNSQTGLVYVANFASDEVTVLNAVGVVTTLSLFDSQEPFGIAVDAARNYVYVSTVGSNRIVAIDAANNQVLGWTAFVRQRGAGDSRVPLRALAINAAPDADGNRHLWAVTASEDAIAEPEQYSQVLLIAKGYPGFDAPVPDPATPGSIADWGLRNAEIAVNPITNRVYLNLAAGDAVRVLGDSSIKCFGVPFKTRPDITAVSNP